MPRTSLPNHLRGQAKEAWLNYDSLAAGVMSIPVKERTERQQAKLRRWQSKRYRAGLSEEQRVRIRKRQVAENHSSALSLIHI